MVSAFLALALLATISLATVTSAVNDNASTELRRTCSATLASNPQSFESNFVNALQILSPQVANTGFGIADVARDDPSSRVYSLAQCFNYLPNKECRLCFRNLGVKLTNCLTASSARLYLNGCYLRYAGYNFSQEAVDSSSDTSVCKSSGNVSDTVKFREATNGLIQNLTLGAYENRDYYKEGNASVSSDVKVYGIAQCWRTLNKSGCRECMESAGKRIVGCLPRSEGAALNTGCFVRYSLKPFYVYESPSGSGSSSVSLIRRVGAALGATFGAVLVIAAALIWRRRNSRGDDFEDTHGSSEILRKFSESDLSFKYNDLKNATRNFDLGNKLGQGGYGTVYKGILPDGREIAVKRLFVNSTQWLDQFFNEVNLISQVQHKNLAQLFGCSVDGPESLLVYEYLCNASLDRFLFDSVRKSALDWGRRFNILVGAAEGLAYLHKASVVRIIHRDVKAGNVLLDERFRPKVADFGLARYFAEGQSHLSTGVAGTLGYMAPEYVVHGQLTEKADVYSYGILVLEVVTGRKNTASISPSKESHSLEGQILTAQIWRHFTSSSVIEMLDPSLEGQCSIEEVSKVFHIGLLCTQASPNLRPAMWNVVEMLLGEGRDLPLPTQPPFINFRDVEPGSVAPSSAPKQPASVNQLSVSIMEGR